MKVQAPHSELELPSGIRGKLEEFRRRVWMVKLAEGLLAALFGLLLSYLFVFVMDRFWDTPGWMRALILVAGAAGLGIWFPLKWHRWVWRTRQLEQVSRLLRHKMPRLGDQLLGIVELVHSEVEQERSEALCIAAMKQVDAETRHRDFTGAVPNPRHRQWAWAAGVPLAIAVAALVIVPAAGTNALSRWLMPWRNTERYTFAQLDKLPNKMVVPYAEPFSIKASLAEQTSWSPSRGTARYGEQDAIQAELEDGKYDFQISPQKQPDTLTVSVGDVKKAVHVEPTTRPELTSMIARVELPDYLQYSRGLTKDVRGGSVSLVKGSRATFEATATRGLKKAELDGTPQQTSGNTLLTASMTIDDSASPKFTWEDEFGLSAKEPFELSIVAEDDGSPSITCSQLARQQVVLDEEVLSFEVQAGDDFGVKTIGMEWSGVEDPLRNPHPDHGEKIISAGGPEQREVDASATFSAKREGIDAQTLQLRIFAEDYLPGRERAYSPTYILHVLTPEEHAIWLTNQLRRWFRHAQGVYEREQQLYETNKELRALSAAEIDQPDNRRRIETQAAAEQANARQLGALTSAGEGLIKEATKNDQFNVETLENWAQMLNTLKDLADNRMPSVADLLKQAAAAPGSANPGKPGQAPPSDSSGQPPPPQVGVNRDGRSGAGKSKEKEDEPNQIPSIADVESSFNELNDDPEQKEQEPSESGASRFTLPSTVVQGGGLPPEKQDQKQASPASEKVDEAVEQQEDLLAEFAKVADELQKILNNLEGSTFVKRLKAASRRQLEVAGDLNNMLFGSFGVKPDEVDQETRDTSAKIAEREVLQSDNVYIIQEDMDAYYNRVQQGKFKTVLNEMRRHAGRGQVAGRGRHRQLQSQRRVDRHCRVLGRQLGPMGGTARRPWVTERGLVTGLQKRWQSATFDRSGSDEDFGKRNRFARGNAGGRTGPRRAID